MRAEVLNHGYVELVESWGSEERVIQSARMSTDSTDRGWGPFPCPGPNCMPVEHMGDVNYCEHRPRCDNGFIPGDEKLLRFLYEKRHMTPFEMCGMTIEVMAPIFVFREWHRHRTQSYNEMSARYIPLPDVNYVPTVERLMLSGGTNKQAQGTGAKIDEKGAEDFRAALVDHYKAADALYRLSLGAAGVPKELARLVIPVGRYSRMRASANLRNWLQFLTLRDDPAAQWEIQQYAKLVADLIRTQFPRTYALYLEGKARS